MPVPPRRVSMSRAPPRSVSTPRHRSRNGGHTVHIKVEVDGVTYEDDVPPRLLLVHYLRDRLGKVGTPIGCDTTNCGACTMHLDGVSVKSCSVLAVQADGRQVTTVEGLGVGGEPHPMQRA